MCLPRVQERGKRVFVRTCFLVFRVRHPLNSPSPLLVVGLVRFVRLSLLLREVREGSTVHQECLVSKRTRHLTRFLGTKRRRSEDFRSPYLVKLYIDYLRRG